MSIDRIFRDCQKQYMFELSEDPKQKAILDAAWAAFAAYGFRKASMDDIARGAGMSRPALYLHFRNKEAIFGGLVQSHYGLVLVQIDAGLAGSGSLAERLTAGFVAQGGPAMEMMMTSPHGMELFDASMNVAGEAISEGERALQRLYARWLEAEADAGRAVLSGPASDVARTFCAAMKGIKHTSGDYGTYQSGVRQLAALFGAALTPR